MESLGTLSAQDQVTLLRLARGAIECHLDPVEGRRSPDQDAPLGPALQVSRAAFVTLTIVGRLRGCIGDLLPCRPLYRSVMVNAVSAASRDTRFSPVSGPELPKLRIEISALTVPEAVDTHRDIHLGRDGILLEKAGRRAVFLPQVATEQGWTLEETLSHLALKAGLRFDEWRQGARFSTFQAQVFGD